MKILYKAKKCVKREKIRQLWKERFFKRRSWLFSRGGAPRSTPHLSSSWTLAKPQRRLSGFFFLKMSWKFWDKMYHLCWQSLWVCLGHLLQCCIQLCCHRQTSEHKIQSFCFAFNTFWESDFPRTASMVNHQSCEM